MRGMRVDLGDPARREKARSKRVVSQVEFCVDPVGRSRTPPSGLCGKFGSEFSMTGVDPNRSVIEESWQRAKNARPAPTGECRMKKIHRGKHPGTENEQI